MLKTALGLALTLVLATATTSCQESALSPDDPATARSSQATLDRSHPAPIPDAAPRNHRMQHFVAPLSGDQEVPGVGTDATGVARFRLDPENGELHYQLIVANIDGVTQAHIHCAPAGTNGPVIAFLFGLEADGVTVNGPLASGTITADDVIERPDSPACTGGVVGFDDLVDMLRQGNAYVNVHTLEHPSGEIRGQIRSGHGHH